MATKRARPRPASPGTPAPDWNLRLKTALAEAFWATLMLRSRDSNRDLHEGTGATIRAVQAVLATGIPARSTYAKTLERELERIAEETHGLTASLARRRELARQRVIRTFGLRWPVEEFAKLVASCLEPWIRQEEVDAAYEEREHARIPAAVKRAVRVDGRGVGGGAVIGGDVDEILLAGLKAGGASREVLRWWHDDRRKKERRTSTRVRQPPR